MNWKEDSLPPPQKSNVGWLLLGALLLLALYAGVSIYRNQTPSAEPLVNEGIAHPSVGKVVTDLRFDPLVNATEPIEPGDFQGKVTLINFWGTWCPPCRVEFPHMAVIEKDFRAEPDFQFVSVSVPARGEDDGNLAELTDNFLVSKGAKFPVYRDRNLDTHNTLLKSAELSRNQFGYPATVLLDRTGRIRAFWVGYKAGWEKHIEETVRKTLKGEPTEEKETKPAAE